MTRFLRKCLHYFAFAGFFSLFINTLYLTFPIYMEAIYVRVLASYSFSTLYVVTIAATGALVIQGILEFLRSRILVKVGLKMDKLLGRTVLKEMLKESASINSPNYDSGLADINFFRSYLAGNGILAFFDLPWIPIYLAVIYLMHPILGMTATGGALVLLFLGLLQNFITRKDADKINDSKGEHRHFVLKSLRTSPMLKSMGMLQNTANHWHGINDREMALQASADRKGHALGAIGDSFRTFMQVAIYGIGALLVIKNEVNIGSIIAASIIMGRALAPIQQGIMALKQAIDVKAAYQRLNRLLNDAKEARLEKVESLKGNLTVLNAGLLYDGKTILEDLSFSLEKGESMGLIGHNGAGKTSLCRMLLGMWTPTSGEVLLDGRAAASLDPDALGPFIGYLPQNVELFSGTVSENIARMGPVDSKRVVEAARMAGAHETILRFLTGYETDIGEAGLSLSGGQRQRVGLARALYGNPSLIILDEPNSNLDEAGEAALMQALNRLKTQGTTVIIITHKPSLLSGVDKILVLNQGRATDFGDRNAVFGRTAGQDR